MKKLIVFTDLDGTLLDSRTYSFEEARPALDLLKEKRFPLVLCSSKTRAEIEHYRRLLQNSDPFISENGGGVFIPKGYFSFHIGGDCPVEERGDYILLRLGAPYDHLRNIFKELANRGFHIKGFGDMSPEEISGLAGLSLEESLMAGEREFDEPFVFRGTEEEKARLISAIEEKGLNYTQGRFFHLMGASDKGRAVAILMEFYKKAFGEISTIALGDGLNDLPMLFLADHPVLVANARGEYDERINLPSLMRAPGPGSAGWGRAVLELLGKGLPERW